MSIFTQVALPLTLTDLLDARNRALELHKQSRRLNEAAAELLDQHGRYLMPRSSRYMGRLDEAVQELDASMWRRAFDLTGFKNLMDAEAVDEFEKDLDRSPLEFTEGNVRATFIELQGRADEMFKRGIVNVFSSLSGNYKTNTREPFRVARKLILCGMVVPSFSGGRTINYGRASDQINDVDRVMAVLDGRQFKPRELESEMNAVFMKNEVFESDYYRARAFKNGNLHLEFLRDELLEKINELIAGYYSDGALAHGGKQ